MNFSNKKILFPIFIGFVIISGFAVILLLNQPRNSTFEWRISTPEKQGFNSVILQNMTEFIQREDINLHSCLIIRNDVLVFEQYYFVYDKTRKHEIWSCTKSVTSSLIGIAIDKGYLNIDDIVINLFPNKTYANIDGRKQRMTVEHLLTMTSGLEWAGDTEYVSMYPLSDWIQYVLDKPMVAEPGKVFNYHTGGSHVLAAILETVTGNKTIDFANEYLFGPLGIDSGSISWTVDNNGIARGGSGLFMTPRDMARFGLLFLHDGLWNGKQLISSNWVLESTRGHFNDFYGYQWWIYPSIDIDGHVIKNSFAARGYLEQMIYVMPDFDLVVVFTSNIVGGFRPDDLMNDFILPALL
ncbi:MAG: serine hydrolase domain-containing protein [Candidatus Hodarchaeota archaeon]